MCWGGFSLKLRQLDPGQEISMRCLSVNLAIILLWSNPRWLPSTIMKKSDFLFLSLISCVIPLISLIQGCRIHSWYYFDHLGWSWPWKAILKVNVQAFISKSQQYCMYCNTYIQFRTQKPSLGRIFFINWLILGCLKPYTSRGRSFRKGGSSYRRSGEDSDRSRSAPSSTVTQLSTIPQELNKHQVQTHDMRVLPVVNVNRGSIRVTRRNEGVVPPQSIQVKHDCVSLWRGGSV